MLSRRSLRTKLVVVIAAATLPVLALAGLPLHLRAQIGVVGLHDLATGNVIIAADDEIQMAIQEVAEQLAFLAELVLIHDEAGVEQGQRRPIEVHADVWAETDSQKAILIGAGGGMVRSIVAGIPARVIRMREVPKTLRWS